MRFTSLLFGTAALALSAFPAAAQDAASYDADTVVATVNGTEITIGHMIAYRDALPAEYARLPDAQLYSGILNQLVDQQLLADEAARLGKDEGERVRLTIENDRRGTLAGIVISDMLDEAVTEDAVQAAYAQVVASFDGETEYNASHILVETREEAASLVEQLNAGADFAELAQEFSTGPTGPNGGNLGWFAAGVMVQPFSEAVEGMTPETVSGPVQTQFGWHVIRLNETRETTPPSLAEMRDGIIAELRNNALQAHLDALNDAADIVVAGDAVPETALSTVQLDD